MFRKEDWHNAVRQWPTSAIVGGVLAALATGIAKMIGVPSLDQLEWPVLTGLGYLLIFFVSGFLSVLLLAAVRWSTGGLEIIPRMPGWLVAWLKKTLPPPTVATGARAQRATAGVDRQKLLGFSAHTAIRIRDVTAIRRKYVFDIGAPDGARVAFYQSASDRFVLEARDVRGEAYPLEVPIGRGGIPIGRFVYLSADVGLDDTSTILSVSVNGRVVQSRTLSFRIDLGSRNWSNVTIGADATGKNNGGFGLGEFTHFSTTLEAHEAEQLCAYFLREGGLVDVNPQADSKAEPPIEAQHAAAARAQGTPRAAVERIPGDEQPPLRLAFQALADGSLRRAEALFGFGTGTLGVSVPWFHIAGSNQSSEPIVLYDAYIVPRLTNEKVQLTFRTDLNEYTHIHDTYGIPAQAPFTLAVRTPGQPSDTRRGALTVSDFLQQIGGFQIVIEAVGYATMRLDVSYREAETMLRAAEAHHTPPPPQPSVRRRE